MCKFSSIRDYQASHLTESLSDAPQGYRCLECGDAFALEQSLAQHYDRRSLRIEVTCNHCAKRLAFFNKCSLLLHAREHKERGLIMQCSHLVMKPVPVDLMISQPEAAKEGWRIFVDWLFFCFKVSPTLLYFTPLGSSSSVLGQATSKLWSLTGKGVEAAPNTSIKCPECHTQFSSKEELADHFQEVKSAHSTVSFSVLSNDCRGGQKVGQFPVRELYIAVGRTFKYFKVVNSDIPWFFSYFIFKTIMYLVYMGILSILYK